jgi:peptidoglycan lytic transglycosylase
VPDSALDSARDEMRVGRFWHATRILRAAGASEGDPGQVLLLARAEAGWMDWRAVRELLEGARWLDAQEHGEGWRLLALAEEDAGRWQEAADAFQAYLTHAAPDDEGIPAAETRRARALARAGNVSAAMATLTGLEPTAAVARSWMAVELARRAGEEGDTGRVSALMDLVTDEGAAGATWLTLAHARLTAGDTAGGLAALRSVSASTAGATRAEADVEAGVLLMARGRVDEARELLVPAVDSAPASAAGRAAAALVDAGGNDRALLLRLGPVLDRAGDGSRALKAYDMAYADAKKGGAPLSEWARLTRARLMATIRGRQDEALEEFRALYASTRDARVGARTLEVWAEVRHSQGRTAEEKVLRRWLLERYPASAEAVAVLWDQATQAESEGDVKGALKSYASLIANAPRHARAGEARMRTAQIALGRGDEEKAAHVYEAYLKDFPDGRRWDEASYWTARLALRAGDTVTARALVARIRREEPISYYAVVGADLIHAPYDVDVPPGDEPEVPEWLGEGLDRLDLLEAAGLDQGADTEEDRLVARAQGSRSALLALAEALIERGRTVRGINLGWELRGEGSTWNRRLLRVVYPFPYRELVRREAAEWGLDPIMLAALIRQESAFSADVVSGAGAVGLMQVMPPTGRALARTHGPVDFSDESLTTPEVNLHLGAAFFLQMSRRYGGDLPLVLAAYNAGPTRATRWRNYPEVEDPLRFTERIPFDETRGYVKNVTRNVGLYQALYGVQ